VLLVRCLLAAASWAWSLGRSWPSSLDAYRCHSTSSQQALSPTSIQIRGCGMVGNGHLARRCLCYGDGAISCHNHFPGERAVHRKVQVSFLNLLRLPFRPRRPQPGLATRKDGFHTCEPRSRLGEDFQSHFLCHGLATLRPQPRRRCHTVS